MPRSINGKFDGGIEQFKDRRKMRINVSTPDGKKMPELSEITKYDVLVILSRLLGGYFLIKGISYINNAF